MNENEMNFDVALDENISSEETETSEEISEVDMLKGEVERLKCELEASLERERGNARIISECSEFSKYFPNVDLQAVPDEVWESVKSGIPLSHSYALYEKKLAIAKATAESINARNSNMSSGAVTSGAEEHYFSPEEVKKMTRSEVKKNYSEIVESMKHWH